MHRLATMSCCLGMNSHRLATMLRHRNPTIPPQERAQSNAKTTCFCPNLTPSSAFLPQKPPKNQQNRHLPLANSPKSLILWAVLAWMSAFLFRHWTAGPTSILHFRHGTKEIFHG
jgi:hypothetical protein